MSIVYRDFIFPMLQLFVSILKVVWDILSNRRSRK